MQELVDVDGLSCDRVAHGFAVLVAHLHGNRVLSAVDHSFSESTKSEVVLAQVSWKTANVSLVHLLANFRVVAASREQDASRCIVEVAVVQVLHHQQGSSVVLVSWHHDVVVKRQGLVHLKACLK